MLRGIDQFWNTSANLRDHNIMTFLITFNYHFVIQRSVAQLWTLACNALNPSRLVGNNPTKRIKSLYFPSSILLLLLAWLKCFTYINCRKNAVSVGSWWGAGQHFFLYIWLTTRARQLKYHSVRLFKIMKRDGFCIKLTRA